MHKRTYPVHKDFTVIPLLAYSIGNKALHRLAFSGKQTASQHLLLPGIHGYYMHPSFRFFQMFSSERQNMTEADQRPLGAVVHVCLLETDVHFLFSLPNTHLYFATGGNVHR